MQKIRRTLKAAPALLVALFIQSNLLAQTHPQWGDLKSGPYAIGFKAEHKYDYSRTYKPKYDYDGKFEAGERARPIQISIWYPAASAKNAKPMLYEEYVYLTAKEVRFGELTAEDQQQSKNQFRTPPFARNVSEADFNKLMQTPTAAIRNTAPQAGRFPLIVFAQGFNMSPLTNSILCEYLASHGYVVASNPSMGMVSRQMSFDLIGLESQLRDLEFIIAAARELPYVDFNKLAAIGFSFGGLPIAILAMRNTDVDALISLDSSIGFNLSLSILMQSPYYDPAKVRVPLMHFMTRRDAPANVDLSFYDALKYSNAYLVKMDSLRHFDFTAFGMLAAMVPNFNGKPPKEVKLGNELVCRYALHFLNACVKGDQASLAFLKNNPEANGAPAGFLALESKAALKAPPTEDQFVQLIRNKGCDEASRIYQEVKKIDPETEIFREFVINNLGYEFLQSQRVAEAIKIFKLNVEAFPDSWNVYDSLAEGYMVNGDKQLAIEFYNKSLEINPDNTNGKQMLERITGTVNQ
jgi:tetratricopeptide (TPR) repeat protein